MAHSKRNGSTDLEEGDSDEQLRLSQRQETIKQILQDLKCRWMSPYRTGTTAVSESYLSDDTPVNKSADLLRQCST